jgi:hypothetical protein
MIKLTVETKAQIMVVFSFRRKKFLDLWLSAHETEMNYGFGPVCTSQWASEIQSLNDAEAELLAAIYN